MNKSRKTRLTLTIILSYWLLLWSVQSYGDDNAKSYQSQCVTKVPVQQDNGEACSATEKCHSAPEGKYYLTSSLTVKCAHCGGKRKRKEKRCPYRFAGYKKFSNQMRPTELCVSAHAESTFDKVPLAGWSKCHFAVSVSGE